MTSEIQKFNLEEAEQTIREALENNARKFSIADNPDSIHAVQHRQGETCVAFNLWILSEYNKGTKPAYIAASAGYLAAKFLQSATNHQSPEFSALVMQSFDYAMAQEAASEDPIISSKKVN